MQRPPTLRRRATALALGLLVTVVAIWTTTGSNRTQAVATSTPSPQPATLRTHSDELIAEHSRAVTAWYQQAAANDHQAALDAWYQQAAINDAYTRQQRNVATDRVQRGRSQSPKAIAAAPGSAPLPECPYADLIAVHFADPAHACRIEMCESHGNPNAHNPSGASGLFQIMMPMHAGLFAAHGWPPSSVFDPERNITIAGEMVESSGWSGWVCK